MTRAMIDAPTDSAAPRLRDYGHTLEFGVFIEPAARSADQVVALSALAEEAGDDLVTSNAHPSSPRALDSLTLMSFVAARTGRVRLAANVLSLPLRPPAVLAGAVGSLDISAAGGRVSGKAPRVIRERCNAGERGGARLEGKHYRLAGALRGPAPVHHVSIWVGAYKPRMLRLVGRLADGWLPTIAGLKPGALAAGNAIIDAAAARAGREPQAIRRLLNLGAVEAPARETAAALARLALEDGIATLIVTVNDPRTMTDFAAEVAPRIREAVEEARLRGLGPPHAAVGSSLVRASAQVQTATHFETEDERLGVAPTPDERIRLSERAPWDDSTRPHRDRSGPEVSYTDQGRRDGKQLIEVHNLLRSELSELRDILRQVRDGAMRAGDARAALNEMALRQNDWTRGPFAPRYCGVVTMHHGVKDASMFPPLTRREPQLKPVIDRLTEEHLVIHDAIQEGDRALIEHMTRPENHDAIQSAIDYLTDALLSHLAYEERELVEPLARLGL